MTQGGFDNFLSLSTQAGSVLKDWGFSWNPSPNKREKSSTHRVDNPLGNSEITASNIIYGSQTLGPILTQWQTIPVHQPAKAVEKTENLDSTLHKVEKHLFKYFSAADFFKLTKISRSHREYFWRFLFIQLLKEAPRFESKYLPNIDTPFIPVNYQESRIITDASQKMPPMVLGIAKSLLQIKPEDMGNNTFMQGSLALPKTPSDAEPKIVHYYLVRCVARKSGYSDRQCVIIIFKCPSGIFVIDTANTAIESYHPESPVRFSYISDLFRDLILKESGTMACEVKPDEEGTIGAAIKPLAINLWNPGKKLLQSYPLEIINLNTAVTHDQMGYRKDLIAMRTILAAMSFFSMLHISPWALRPDYSFTASMIFSSVVFIAEQGRAQYTLDERAIELFSNEETPCSKVMKRIAGSKALIDKIGKQLMDRPHKINAVNEEGRTILSYCKSKKLRELLMFYGANPMEPRQQQSAFMEAVERNDLQMLEEFLSRTPHFTLSALQEAGAAESATIPALELIVKHRPQFNFKATHEDGKTAIERIFSEICNRPIKSQEDLVRKKRLLNKTTYLTQCGSNVDTILATIHAMKDLLGIHHTQASKKLMQAIGPCAETAWLNAHAMSDVWDEYGNLLQNAGKTA